MQKNGTKNQTGGNKLLVRGFKIQTLVKRSEEEGERTREKEEAHCKANITPNKINGRQTNQLSIGLYSTPANVVFTNYFFNNTNNNKN